MRRRPLLRKTAPTCDAHDTHDGHNTYYAYYAYHPCSLRLPCLLYLCRLDAMNKFAKDGYLEKQAFLLRTDQRQAEVARRCNLAASPHSASRPGAPPVTRLSHRRPAMST